MYRQYMMRLHVQTVHDEVAYTENMRLHGQTVHDGTALTENDEAAWTDSA